MSCEFAARKTLSNVDCTGGSSHDARWRADGSPGISAVAERRHGNVVTWQHTAALQSYGTQAAAISAADEACSEPGIEAVVVWSVENNGCRGRGFFVERVPKF